MFFGKSRRGFFATLVALVVIIPRRIVAQSARLDVSQTSAGIRVIATVDPIDSPWELEQSTDNARWTVVPSTQGQTKWNIPVSTNEPTTFFRLKLVTNATMKVSGNTYQLPVNGESLFTIMTNLPLTFKSRLYSGLGQFVTEINEVKKGNGFNWMLFLNGELTTTGSSQVFPKANDRVEWRLI
ncbi:MAG: DUF4430 domain-containing protein [Patescibacteria group bacterium]